MTAIDLRASTMQILERFDKNDTSLWQKVLDAINSIYKNEEESQLAKRAQQKAKIRQMVGILHEENVGDWKRDKPELGGVPFGNVENDRAGAAVAVPCWIRGAAATTAKTIIARRSSCACPMFRAIAGMRAALAIS